MIIENFNIKDYRVSYFNPFPVVNNSLITPHILNTHIDYKKYVNNNVCLIVLVLPTHNCTNILIEKCTIQSNYIQSPFIQCFEVLSVWHRHNYYNINYAIAYLN